MTHTTCGGTCGEMDTVSLSPPEQVEFLQWLTTYLMVEVQCDTPIIEAVIWSHKWVYLEHGNFFTEISETYNYERKFDLITYHNLVTSQGRIIARWAPTTRTLIPLTEYDRALAYALGWDTTDPEPDVYDVAPAPTNSPWSTICGMTFQPPT